LFLAFILVHGLSVLIRLVSNIFAFGLLCLLFDK